MRHLAKDGNSGTGTENKPAGQETDGKDPESIISGNS